MNCEDENELLLASALAMELSRGLDVVELEKLRIFVHQVECSISNLINKKYCNKK